MRKFINAYKNFRKLYNSVFINILSNDIKDLGAEDCVVSNPIDSYTIDIYFNDRKIYLSIIQNKNLFYIFFSISVKDIDSKDEKFKSYYSIDSEESNSPLKKILPDVPTFVKIIEALKNFDVVYNTFDIKRKVDSEIKKVIEETEESRKEYWTKRINSDPNVYALIKKYKLSIPEWDIKFKHLGVDFGFFDK